MVTPDTRTRAFEGTSHCDHNALARHFRGEGGRLSARSRLQGEKKRSKEENPQTQEAAPVQVSLLLRLRRNTITTKKYKARRVGCSTISSKEALLHVEKGCAHLLWQEPRNVCVVFDLCKRPFFLGSARVVRPLGVDRGGGDRVCVVVCERRPVLCRRRLVGGGAVPRPTLTTAWTP